MFAKTETALETHKIAFNLYFSPMHYWVKLKV